MSAAALAEARQALAAAGQLPDEEIDLAATALQLARIDAPDADWQAARAVLSAIAQRAVALALADPAADAGDGEGRRAVLARLLHEEFGFAGDSETYDDLANANLIRVIERRRGLPVALGILWLHAAEAAGWEAHGVDFPGHFLIALRGSEGPVLVDAFAGGKRLEPADLRALLRRLHGAGAELQPGMLTAMGRRAVLLRLQNNIKLRRLKAGDLAGALACTEDMLRLSPDHPLLWRDLGLINERLERNGAALAAFERALALAPPEELAADLRPRIEALRNRLN
ncbi:MAG: transglutaminase-like domain-containing protein [Rhodovarius sp.]|nr:transglutaminase-like domain-containing protein [Rhodovarius sp.]